MSNMSTIQQQRLTALQVAREAVHELSAAFERGGEVFVRTPLMYPGGSSVVVNVTGTGDRFFVSDYALGSHEADIIGAAAQFTRSAPLVAARSAVEIDRRTLYVANVSRAQVAGAVATVANASKDAVDLAALRLSEKREREVADVLIERLRRVFGKGRVHKDAEVRGASSHPWHPMALVESSGHRTAFQHVKGNPQSIYAAVTMFHDIARLTEPPNRVAVSDKIVSLGDYVGVLSQAGEVLEINASDQSFQKTAA